MLEVGVNSYVTIEEADLYVSTFYRVGDQSRDEWFSLDEEDKTALLLQATLAIEHLPIPGRKSKSSQTLMFPRYPEVDVATYVKYAQAEEALIRNDATVVGEYEDTARRMRRGVRSYRLGNFSEAYRVHKPIEGTVLSEKTYMLLSPYIGGGFDICL